MILLQYVIKKINAEALITLDWCCNLFITESGELFINKNHISKERRSNFFLLGKSKNVSSLRLGQIYDVPKDPPMYYLFKKKLRLAYTGNYDSRV